MITSGGYLASGKPRRGMLRIALAAMILSVASPAAATDRRYTAVTPSGLSKMAENERTFYLEVLQNFASNTVTAFLRDLQLTQKEARDAAQMVSFEFLKDESCLSSSTTMLSLAQKLQRGCAPADEHLISSVILPFFFRENQASKIRTIFFPYTLKRLKTTEAFELFVNNVLEYDEPFPPPRERAEMGTLVVLGFLNLYWDTIKDKEKLTEIEQHIVWRGLNEYSRRLRLMCPNFAGSAQAGCENILREAERLLPIVRRKPTE
jgi:hypothetical protein